MSVFPSVVKEETYNLTPPSIKAIIIAQLEAEKKIESGDSVTITFDTGHDRNYDGPGVGCTVFNGVKVVVKKKQ